MSAPYSLFFCPRLWSTCIMHVLKHTHTDTQTRGRETGGYSFVGLPFSSNRHPLCKSFTLGFFSSQAPKGTPCAWTCHWAEFGWEPTIFSTLTALIASCQTCSCNSVNVFQNESALLSLFCPLLRTRGEVKREKGRRWWQLKGIIYSSCPFGIVQIKLITDLHQMSRLKRGKRSC